MRFESYISMYRISPTSTAGIKICNHIVLHHIHSRLVFTCIFSVHTEMFKVSDHTPSHSARSHPTTVVVQIVQIHLSMHVRSNAEWKLCLSCMWIGDTFNFPLSKVVPSYIISICYEYLTLYFQVLSEFTVITK